MTKTRYYSHSTQHTHKFRLSVRLEHSRWFAFRLRLRLRTGPQIHLVLQLGLGLGFSLGFGLELGLGLGLIGFQVPFLDQGSFWYASM
eukprot:COSAG01_NODE_6760_length_3510_cov_44.864263_2_plen_88_part_00